MGTESHGGFKNITINNCVVKPSIDSSVIFGYERGISGITLAIVDGGTLDGVIISNIRIDGPKVPIYLRLGNRGRIYKEGMDKPAVGTYRNVMLNNIIATDADSFGCSITGLPGHPVENISLSNISIQYKGGGKTKDALKRVPELPEHYPESTKFGKLPSYGLYLRHAKNISLSNITLSFENQDHRHAMICDDIRGLNISNFSAQGTLENISLIKLKNSQDVFISDSRVPTDIKLFMSVTGKDTKDIMLTGNNLLKVEKIFESAEDVKVSEIRLEGDFHAD
jgi:polygalacturonase